MVRCRTGNVPYNIRKFAAIGLTGLPQWFSVYLDMNTDLLPSVRRLRAWDWLADLRADERSVLWLARHTGKSSTQVYAYSRGEITPPLDWLDRAWAVIHEGERHA